MKFINWLEEGNWAIDIHNPYIENKESKETQVYKLYRKDKPEAFILIKEDETEFVEGNTALTKLSDLEDVVKRMIGICDFLDAQ